MVDSSSGESSGGAGAGATPVTEDPLRSPRIELARVALEAALALPGVIAGNAGERGIYMTRSAETQLTGVLAVAEPGDRYSVELYLTAALVPLPQLGEQVREAVSSAAQRTGMRGQLGELTITFLDLEPRETGGNRGGAMRA